MWVKLRAKARSFTAHSGNFDGINQGHSKFSKNFEYLFTQSTQMLAASFSDIFLNHIKKIGAVAEIAEIPQYYAMSF